MKTLLFVYGTLKAGYPNNALISDGELLGNHLTEPSYTMYDLGAFPAISLGGDTAIHGEVWRIADLELTDYLEGYPLFYDRVLIPTIYGDAWVYFLPKVDGTVIPDGKW
jgi:gamma-glutamylaminecyclotransferase